MWKIHGHYIILHVKKSVNMLLTRLRCIYTSNWMLSSILNSLVTIDSLNKYILHVWREKQETVLLRLSGVPVS